eukprot:GHVU01146059.1.p1 GENE.GHVU01146059.1~~GHVU01146059.1.p1  ORF type:complete len:307 (-),score=33.85 GHVU01146059.1:26-946(-)
MSVAEPKKNCLEFYFFKLIAEPPDCAGQVQGVYSSRRNSFTGARECSLEALPSTKQLELRFPFNEEVLKFVKTIPDRKYDARSKTWWIPQHCAYQAVKYVQHLGGVVELSARDMLLRYLSQVFSDSVIDVEAMARESLDSGQVLQGWGIGEVCIRMWLSGPAVSQQPTAKLESGRRIESATKVLRASLEFNGYDEQAGRAVKTQLKGRWQPEDKSWGIQGVYAGDLPEVMEKLGYKPVKKTQSALLASLCDSQRLNPTRPPAPAPYGNLPRRGGGASGVNPGRLQAVGEGSRTAMDAERSGVKRRR